MARLERSLAHAPPVAVPTGAASRLSRPRMLDGYCGAGLAAEGYAAAGFEIAVGVDIANQPDYPFPFALGDVLEDGWLDVDWLRQFSFAHFSPPCQLHTRASKLRDAQRGTSRYPDLLSPTLERLRKTDAPWVVENVPDAKPLMRPQTGEALVMLCGSMFGLKVQRHRWFLSNVPIVGPGQCNHATFDADPITGKPRPWGVYHVVGDSIPSGGRTVRTVEHGHEVMGMTRQVSWTGLKEGVPPAYTRWIGGQMLRYVQHRVVWES